SLSQVVRQAGVEGLLNRRLKVIINAPDGELLGIRIVDHIAGLGIAIPRLAHAPHIDQVTVTRLERIFLSGKNFHRAVGLLLGDKGLMDMPKETEVSLE